MPQKSIQSKEEKSDKRSSDMPAKKTVVKVIFLIYKLSYGTRSKSEKYSTTVCLKEIKPLYSRCLTMQVYFWRFNLCYCEFRVLIPKGHHGNFGTDTQPEVSNFVVAGNGNVAALHSSFKYFVYPPISSFVYLTQAESTMTMYRVCGMAEARSRKGESTVRKSIFESTPRAAVERFVELVIAEKDGRDMVGGRLLHRIVLTKLDARIMDIAYLTERAPVLVADNKQGKLIWEDAHEEDEMDLRLNFLHVRGSPDESPLEIEYRRPVQSKKNPNRKSAFVNIFGYFYQVRTDKNKVSHIVLVEYIE